MFGIHRSRFFFILIRTLASKYRFALVFGFILGLTGSLGLLRLAPVIEHRFFRPVDRIGLVGQYSPTTLPVEIQELISGGLTTIARDGWVEPALATSWETQDGGKSYVFTLRSDLVWHNGKPVSAGDVNYNIRDVAFDALDQTTLRADLKDPYSPFPTLVTKPIMKAGLIGFGPYRVDTIKLKGDSIQYIKLVPVANRGAPVKEFRFYRSEALAIVGFKRGDVDILTDIGSPPDTLLSFGRVAATPTVHTDRIVGLFYNTRQGKLAERNFRLGLSYAVPDPSEEKTDSPFPKNSWATTETIRRFSYSPDQAKKLLQNSQNATSSATLTLATFIPFASQAEEIAKSWITLGVPTSVRIINDTSEGFDVLMASQTLPPDPDQYPFWHSTQKSTNITGYVNVRIDKLLEDGRREIDMEKRKKIYADFAKRLTDDAPVRFLYYPKTYTIRRLH